MVYLPTDYKNLFPAIKQHKYRAVPVVVDGIKFPSTKEGKRYKELKLQEHCGIITELKRQPEFVLQDSFLHKGIKIEEIKYRADFRYFKNGQDIIEDCKGVRTPEYKLKKKMFLKRYPDLDILET